jgi:DNA-binding beta-propeller fold protein YncE
MAANEFNCPKCGGIITIKEDDDLTTHCPYCDSLIEVPEKLRREKPDKTMVVLLNGLEEIDQTQTPTRRRGIAILIAIVSVLVLGVVLFFVFSAANRDAGGVIGGEPLATTLPPTEAPTVTPTPNFAFQINIFGSSGIGEGMFNNPHYIDADGLGNVYVADYDNGRIQRFNTDGKYVGSWSVTSNGDIIHGMAASYTGFVYVSVGNYINKYDGQNGQLLASIQANGEEEYGDLATTIDGNLVAVWYEGRWGIITSLEGHREDLVMFDPDLNIMTSKQAFISALTGDLQSEVHLTVDGNGTIYAESNSTIFVFDKNGNFIDRFTPSEGTLGSFSWVNDIAVDGQGRIYVVESYTIHVFDSNFSFIDDIPLEINVFAIAIDAQNYIWALSSDQVQELQLRQ